MTGSTERRRHAWLRLAAAVAIAAMVAACDEASETAAPPPAASRPKVALVMKTLTNPFFIEMERGARRAAKDFGVDLVVRTAAQETSIEQQIAIIDDLIRAHVDAIVVAPGDSARLIPVLKKAHDEGIAVVNVDNALDPALAASFGLPKVPFISVDNEAGAYKAAAAIAAAAPPGPAEALIIEGIRDAANAEARRRGAARGFKDAGRIEVVESETANWKIDEAYAVSKAAFAAHPDIDLVFAANDMMALGVAHYLKDTGRRDVLIAGFDNLEEARQAIHAGEIAVTVDQQAGEQGYEGVATALRLLKGETPPERTILDTVLIDRTNAGP